MKSNFHRSITVFMAFLVLMSSTGFAFIEHQCLVRGKSVQVVADLKQDAAKEKSASSCCAKSKQLKDQKGTFFKKTDCCKESQTFEKLEVATSTSQQIAKLIKAWSNDRLLPQPLNFAIFYKNKIPADEPPYPDNSFTSRLYGKSMRCLIQSYLI